MKNVQTENISEKTKRDEKTETLKLHSAPLSGSLRIQPSKYFSHRCLIAAALADGTSRLSGVAENDDVEATRRILEALDLAACSRDGTDVVVSGKGRPSARIVPDPLDCNESGSTLRFLLPLPAVWGAEALFDGRPGLLQRPMGPFENLFKTHGLKFIRENGGAIRVSGRLLSGCFELPGDVSSQFVSGLLFALPLLDGDSEIRLTSPLRSGGYVAMTLEVLNRFGVEAAWDGPDRIRIPGRQAYRPADIRIGGDWAHAAFFLTAGAISASPELTLSGLENAGQDREIVDVLQKMGADIVQSGGNWIVRKSPLKAIELDGDEIPDLIPVLSVAACAAEGESLLKNLGRLRYKESNRLEGLAEQLKCLGADVRVEEDSLRIQGQGQIKLRGGSVDSLGDHRLAMSLAVASLICDSPVSLSRPGSVAKSAPLFWREFRSLGGAVDGQHLG